MTISLPAAYPTWNCPAWSLSLALSLSADVCVCVHAKMYEKISLALFFFSYFIEHFYHVHIDNLTLSPLSFSVSLHR